MRLSNSEKNNISIELKNVVNRLPRSVQFPVKYEQRTSLLDGLYDDSLHQAWDTLKKCNEHMLAETSSHRFRFLYKETDEAQSWLVIEFRHPAYGPHLNKGYDSGKLITLDRNYAHYDKLFDWGVHKATAFEEAQMARKYVEAGVLACTSFGQVARILPGVHQYLHERYGKSLECAERKSRVPISFASEYSPELRDKVMNVIAKASLVPSVDHEPYGHKAAAFFKVLRKTPASS